MNDEWSLGCEEMDKEEIERRVEDYMEGMNDNYEVREKRRLFERKKDLD